MGPDVPARPLAPAARHAHGAVEILLVAVLLALFVRTFLVQAFVVPTPSMEETVLVGDYVLVNKFVYAPHASWERPLLPFCNVQRGHVVVFRSVDDPGSDLIKRAVAVSGDVLEIRDRVLIVNGVPQKEPWAHHRDPSAAADDRTSPETLRRRDQLAPTRIADGTCFVMGDNRENSNDSRFWGPVPAQNLKGRALLIYWSSAPPEAGRSQSRWRSLAEFFRRARWSRLLRCVC
jgi:signal peptidase I